MTKKVEDMSEEELEKAMSNNRDEMDVVFHFSNDAQALIAAGKIQRWEVVKWSVTVNVALAAASVASEKAQFFLLCAAILIAVFGWVLLNHYNDRMTKKRTGLKNMYKHLITIININKISGEAYDRQKDDDYDIKELRIFRWAIGLSVIPVLVAWLF